jgi:hypothetical protein
MPTTTQNLLWGRKSQALRETVDLRLWLKRCKEAGIATIGAAICPFELKIEEVIGMSPNNPHLQKLSTWTETQVTNTPKGAMWRWSLCAPIEVKAAMSHPGLPVRLPWPHEAIDDERFQDIRKECQEAGIKTVTAIVRPWIQAALEDGFPVEFRVFVTKTGETSTTSYYTQRPLGKKWRPVAEEAAKRAKTLRPLVKNTVEYSADFLVTPQGEILFIEGGPSPEFGADPCWLDPSEPSENGTIALRS